MKEERRKFLRSKCLLPSEVIKLEGKKNLVERASAHDFSCEGLKLSINFNLKPGSCMDLKLYVPEKKLSTSLSAEIVWIKGVDDRLELGLKIKQIDKKTRDEILRWVFPKWLEKESEEKEKQ